VDVPSKEGSKTHETSKTRAALTSRAEVHDDDAVADKVRGPPPDLWKKRLTSIERLPDALELVSLTYVVPIASSFALGGVSRQLHPSWP
jgi:hypothetical protein